MSSQDCKRCFRYHGAAPVLPVHGYTLERGVVEHVQRQHRTNANLRLRVAELELRVAKLEETLELTAAWAAERLVSLLEAQLPEPPE